MRGGSAVHPSVAILGYRVVGSNHSLVFIPSQPVLANGITKVIVCAVLSRKLHIKDTVTDVSHKLFVSYNFHTHTHTYIFKTL